MFCDNCGAGVESNSKFCDSCGKALELSVTGGQPVTALGSTEHLGRRWGKPLLIIALLAVAATAAVIAYEKVGGSVTRHPDSSTTQGPTNAVGGVLNSENRTSPEEAVANAFAAILKGDDQKFEQYLPPDESIFRGLPRESKVQIVHLVRLLCGFEDQWEIVNNFDGTIRSGGAHDETIDLIFNGNIGRTPLHDLVVRFRRERNSDTVIASISAPDGPKPLFLAESREETGRYFLKDIALASGPEKSGLTFRDLIHASGKFEKDRDWVWGEGVPAYR